MFFYIQQIYTETESTKLRTLPIIETRLHACAPYPLLMRALRACTPTHLYSHHYALYVPFSSSVVF